jgi:hypothetical protein
VWKAELVRFEQIEMGAGGCFPNLPYGPGSMGLLPIHLPNPDVWDADLGAAATAVGRYGGRYLSTFAIDAMVG